jgi:hypothetical protein
LKTRASNHSGPEVKITKILCLALGTALFFLFGSPISLMPSAPPGAWAQSAAPAPKKPAKIKITFKGGPGYTTSTAVVILGAPNSRVGIDAEYYFLKKKFGKPKVDWNLKRQRVVREKGKVYDRMDIELKDGTKKTIFFDITEFFGKL